MTKSQLQKELLEKVKEGVKPSTLKKSKSLNDLPTSTKSPPLKSSHSTTDIPLLPSGELEDKISVLELTIETKDRELEDKDQTIKDYQKADEEIKKTKQELDDSLFARAEAVKQFGVIYAKLKSIRKELEENITQSTDELINQDQIITKLRTSQLRAQTRIQELEKDLTLKNFSYSSPENDLSYLKYGFYGLILLLLAL